MTLPQDVAGAARHAALGSLGDLAQSPLARATLRYWWVTVPIGYAAYRSWQQRKAAKGTAHPIDVVMDIAPLVTLVAGLVMLNQCLASAQPKPAQVLRAAPTPRDADFTLRRPAPAADSPEPVEN